MKPTQGPRPGEGLGRPLGTASRALNLFERRRDALYDVHAALRTFGRRPMPSWRGSVGILRCGSWAVEADCDTGETKVVRSGPQRRADWRGANDDDGADRAMAETVECQVRAAWTNG